MVVDGRSGETLRRTISKRKGTSVDALSDMVGLHTALKTDSGCGYFRNVDQPFGEIGCAALISSAALRLLKNLSIC
jgi:hypothetical protein